MKNSATYKTHARSFSYNLEDCYDSNLCRIIFEHEDALGRRQVAETIAKEILGDRPGRVLGVYGSWGAGKSYLLGQVIDELLTRNRDEKNKERAICCVFSPWRYELEGDLGVGLLKTLRNFQNQFSQESSPSELTKKIEDKAHLIVRIALRLAPSIMPADPNARMVLESARAGAEIAENVLTQANELQNRSKNDEFEIYTDKLHDEMKEFVKLILDAAYEGDKNKSERHLYRLVVFIDDLDRCSPENMVRLFEWLKVHLNVEGCVYVLALDHVAAARAVVGKYRQYLGDDKDLGYGFRYLEKLVDSEYEITTATKTEKMAVQSVYGISNHLLKEAIGLHHQNGQSVGDQYISDLLEFRCLNTPRTMLKIIARFQRTMKTLEEEKVQDFVNRLPSGYQFWVAFLIAMSYQLDPDELTQFLRGRGDIFALINNPRTKTNSYLPGTPADEFCDLARKISNSGLQMPAGEDLLRLAEIIRTNTVSKYHSM